MSSTVRIIVTADIDSSANLRSRDTPVLGVDGYRVWVYPDGNWTVVSKYRTPPDSPATWRGFFVCGEVAMATITTAPNQLIFEAVAKAREARHHDGCRCFLYHSTEVEDYGSPYCCREEWLWTKAISHLLDQLAGRPSVV